MPSTGSSLYRGITNDGEILKYSMNIIRYDLKCLRSLRGYAQQKPVFFYKSNRDYLIFGRQISQLGDGVRALGQQNEAFIGMTLILIFDEALGLY